MIEECINYGIPVLLFGGSNRYNHLSNTSNKFELNNSLLYNFNDSDILTEVILNILNGKNKRKNSTSRDIFLWDNNIKNIEKFIEDLLNE